MPDFVRPQCGWGRPFWIARSRHISTGPSVNWGTRIWQYHSRCPIRLCRAGNLGPDAQAGLFTVAGWTVGTQGSYQAWSPSLSSTVEAAFLSSYQPWLLLTTFYLVLFLPCLSLTYLLTHPVCLILSFPEKSTSLVTIFRYSCQVTSISSHLKMSYFLFL